MGTEPEARNRYRLCPGGSSICLVTKRCPLHPEASVWPVPRFSSLICRGAKTLLPRHTHGRSSSMLCQYEGRNCCHGGARGIANGDRESAASIEGRAVDDAVYEVQSSDKYTTVYCVVCCRQKVCQDTDEIAKGKTPESFNTEQPWILVVKRRMILSKSRAFWCAKRKLCKLRQLLTT